MSCNDNNKLTGTGGCGCGGSAAAVSTCSCGGKGCGQCYTSAFVRPNFFAGQLLTEDDLQKLGEYVVAKNRLHNRFLFGEGVVCGLEVTCDPCGHGRVTVNPGYALDCCGNDLTLACATTLDINSMIRELRRTKLGAECDDPCAESKLPPVKEERMIDPTKDAVTMKVNPDFANRQYIETKTETATRHFCLYMRYCETASDPVAPYSTGETCGASGCETTRIREGVSFELRCTKEDKPRVDIFTRIRACFGDFGRINKNARDIQYHNTMSGRSQAALDEMRKNAVAAFNESHLREMNAAPAALEGEIRKFETAQPAPAPQPLPTETAPPPPPPPPPAELPTESIAVAPSAAVRPLSEGDVRQGLDALLNTASVIARFYSRPEAERQRLNEQFKVEGPLREAQAALARAVTILETHPAIEMLPSPLERESARATIDLSKELVPGAPYEPDNMQMRLLAQGIVMTPKLQGAAFDSFEEIREWLLDRMDNSNLTDCDLRRELAALVLPTLPTTQDEIRKLTTSDIERMTAALKRIASIFIRYLRDCICAAFNPTCVPCDDTSVLLACLEVRDCDVVKICSLERTFVLSPAAMRYWLPPLSLLGELLEMICCTDIDAVGRKLESISRYVDRLFRTQQKEGFGLKQSQATSVVDLIEQLPNFNTAKVANFTRSMTGLFQGSEARMNLRDQGMFTSLGRVESAAVADEAAVPAAAESFAALGALRERLTKEVTTIIDRRIEDRLAEIRKSDVVMRTAPKEEAAVATPKKAKTKTKVKAKDKTSVKDKG